MENLDKRFKYCDSRFFPYLEEVLLRLPAAVKEDILADESFQIFADDGFHDTCVLRHQFDQPLQMMVYLNTKALREPAHQIILTIAFQIAIYAAGKDKAKAEGKDAEDLLLSWGFDDEIKAVRYDQQIAKTEGYKVGYQWARSQNKDYLLQHFGLYIDEWNQRGWHKAFAEIKKTIDRNDAASILKEITRFKEIEPGAAEDKSGAESFSPRQAVLAGIMAAVKEMELSEQYSAKECEIRRI